MAIKVGEIEIETVNVGNDQMDKVVANGTTVYEKAAPTAANCLTFTGENGNDFTLSASKKWDGTMWTSTDTKTWTEWDGTAVSSANGVLYLRGKNTTCYSTNGMQCQLNARAGCSGNIMTLLDYESPNEDILVSKCFRDMFNGCTNLTTAPELPATTLANYCYQYMFNGCTNLTTAPELPATTLADSCYSAMFYGCTNLTTAPELPATTLANYCYSAMFRGCRNLTAAPELPATTLANYCYRDMFEDCRNLTAAPELPATTLANYCYQYMFYGCTNLKLSATQDATYRTPYRIPTTGDGVSASNALTNMFIYTGGTFTGTPEINTTYYGAWD